MTTRREIERRACRTNRELVNVRRSKVMQNYLVHIWGPTIGLIMWDKIRARQLEEDLRALKTRI